MGFFEYTTWFFFCLFVLFCDCQTEIVKIISNKYSNIQFGCVDSDEEIPSNISNLEVKLICGEGSARGTWCQNSKMHPFNFKKPSLEGFFFVGI